MNRLLVTLLFFISEIISYDVVVILHHLNDETIPARTGATASFWIGKTVVYLLAHGLIWIISLSAGSAAHAVATALTLAWAKPIEIASNVIAFETGIASK